MNRKILLFACLYSLLLSPIYWGQNVSNNFHCGNEYLHEKEQSLFPNSLDNYNFMNNINYLYLWKNDITDNHKLLKNNYINSSLKILIL